MGRLGKSYYVICATRFGHAAVREGVRALRRIGLFRDFHLPLDALFLNHEPVRELMCLWARVHWAAGDGMMPPTQLLAIYRLAATWPVDGATVELGSWTGLTTSYLAAACKARGGGRVYAVDTFEGTKEGGGRYRSVAKYGGSTLNVFHDHAESAGVADVVEPIVGLTADVADRYAGPPIRFLLIDADHSYDGVRQDFDGWLPLVAPGGLVVFHDYLMPEVARFVDDDVLLNPRVEAAPGRIDPNIFAVTKRAVPSGVDSKSAKRIEIKRSEPAEVTFS